MLNENKVEIVKNRFFLSSFFTDSSFFSHFVFKMTENNSNKKVFSLPFETILWISVAVGLITYQHNCNITIKPYLI